KLQHLAYKKDGWWHSITGASGFLASWLIKRLLLSGYHVVGTVRDPGNDTKLGHLWNLEGRFDDAIKGCEGVFHMASPILGQPTDPQDILKPVVDGTLNVLRSCKK
ncbi:tetraketide alpha-pyrone reductase 1, partial [Tanacetum coccineum]